MGCENIRLAAGDVLYLPAGLVHYAETDELEGSVHVTFRMQLPGHTALDHLHARCLQLYPNTMCSQLRKQIEDNATMFAWHRLHAGAWPDEFPSIRTVPPTEYGINQLDHVGLTKLLAMSAPSSDSTSAREVH